MQVIQLFTGRIIFREANFLFEKLAIKIYNIYGCVCRFVLSKYESYFVKRVKISKAINQGGTEPVQFLIEYLTKGWAWA